MTERALEEALIDGLRNARTRWNLRQDDVAAAAQWLGLDWTRSTVASLEAGRRRLYVEEYLLLPALLVAAGVPEDLPLHELLGDEPSVALTARLSVPTSMIHLQLIRGAGVLDSELPAVEVQLLEERTAERLGVDVDVVVNASRRLWGQNLTKERDARVEERLDSQRAAVDVEHLPRTARALRGHVTRQLLRELSTELSKGRAKRRGGST